MDDQRRHFTFSAAAAALTVSASRASAQQETRQPLPGEPHAVEFGRLHKKSIAVIYQTTKPDHPQSFPGVRKLLKFTQDNKVITADEAAQINKALDMLERAESDLASVIDRIRETTQWMAKKAGEAANGIINILLSSYEYAKEALPNLSSAETRALIIADVGGALGTAATAILSGLPQLAPLAILLGAGAASAAELVTLENQKLQSGQPGAASSAKPETSRSNGYRRQPLL